MALEVESEYGEPVSETHVAATKANPEILGLVSALFQSSLYLEARFPVGSTEHEISQVLWRGHEVLEDFISRCSKDIQSSVSPDRPTPPKSRAKSRAHGLPPLMKRNPVVKLLGERDHLPMAKGAVAGRPANTGGDVGPNLPKPGRNKRRKFPAPDDVADGGGANDVNDEMLAKAYRCGLRVGRMKRKVRYSLNFLFG